MEKKTQSIAVLGMGCAACSANVERCLRGLGGIADASVSLSTRTATVTYDPDIITLDQMKEAVGNIGYDLVIETDRDIEAEERRAFRTLVGRMLLSWGFALLTMALSMGWIDCGADRNQTMLLLALANILLCGRQFYISAWRQVCHGSANMDTLVTLSTATAFLFSTFNTFFGDAVWTSRGMEWHTYFDAAVMIISFVLTGKVLEERAKKGTASAIRSLMELAPKKALRVDGDELVETPLAALQRGDVIEVRQGGKIPVDGTVLSGDTLIDESMITGESAGVSRGVGDRVLAGTLVSKGVLRFRAEQVGSDTLLANMIAMVEQAQRSKAPVEHIVDRIALFFVPAVAAVAVLTALLWVAIGGISQLPHAILSAVSVLIIACPCAMGLATPMAMMVGIGKAAEKNILVKDATALELMRKVDAIVIDKTGTLTMPSASTADAQAAHEQLKPHAREAVEMLQRQGISLHLMSGDSAEAVATVAHEAGVDSYRSQVKPQDKEDLVRHLQSSGHCVAMVGDGVNDAQALATADVSIAMGMGTDVAMEVAQVTLVGTDLRRLSDAVDLSRKTVRMVRQNLFWAFIYNIVCIPLAAGVLYPVCHFQISPMWASALMAMSSVSVVMNSLRLKWA